MSIGKKLIIIGAIAVPVLGSQGCAMWAPLAERTPRLWEPAADPPAPAVAADTNDPPGDRLTAISFNMQHRDRPAELAAEARCLRDADMTPDFILCQEVLFQRPPSRGRDNTAAVLADELGYYAAGTDRRGSREGVAIVSRYPFDFYDHLHLKARTSPLLLGFARVSVMGEFIVPGIGRVRVVTTHLAYQPFEGHIRRKQLIETLAWLARRQASVPAVVTIFGGDFNLTPGSKELAPLSDMKLTGGLRFMNANTDWPTIGWQGNPYKRVDYIFITAPGRTIRFLGEQLLFKDGLWQNDGARRFYPSDHLMVQHEYVIGPRTFAVAESER